MGRTLLSLSLAALITACSMPWLPDPSAGSMAVQVAWPTRMGIKAIPAETRSITVLVLSNKSKIAVQTLTPSKPEAKFEKLPVGEVTVVATAADGAGKLVAGGKSTVTIKGGETARAEIDLGSPEALKEDLGDLVGVALNAFGDFLKDLLTGVTVPSPPPPPPPPPPTDQPPPPPPSRPPLDIPHFDEFFLEGITNPVNGLATVDVGTVVTGYFRVSGDIDLSTAKAGAAVVGPDGPHFYPLDGDLGQFDGTFTVDMSGLTVLGDYTVVVAITDAKGNSVKTPPMTFRLVGRQ